MDQKLETTTPNTTETNPSTPKFTTSFDLSQVLQPLEPSDQRTTEEKYRDKRTANNHRERLRVRDINQAFVDLSAEISRQTKAEPRTKLQTLQQAVELITFLENDIRERDLVNEVDLRRLEMEVQEILREESNDENDNFFDEIKK